ncbi:PREDICTED: uncharacterized protein LOC108974022 [Bactrocera latifrons]|uniref:uncharacterized protein LOC108974022 n=1 Tax=Bactrocera latifrons TaxID=174628 RepID=UPI0008DCF84A|nr:PREDICTED: uncharacterized protein LOC108974022 [Bactrocera latifrons]
MRADKPTLMNEEGIDISLVQESWANEDTIKGLNSSNYKIFYTWNKGKTRAFILINRSINAVIFSNYSTADITLVKVEEKEKPFFLVSWPMTKTNTRALIGFRGWRKC